ncbi:MAG: Y-family DNA polymerase [Puia sp.]|nr:Y-family DNA polymerase [Puia sp.]
MQAIVDCNSFYCSCERLFRPDLRNRPVVVLSNNDGCIISRSDEAKKLGVGMAGPYFQARHLIGKNDVAVFSSNYPLYGDLSRRVMDTLRILTEHTKENRKVEVYSVDEAFLDLSDIPPRELYEYALHIRNTVEQWTGISVSVGVAPTRTLAKLANGMAKKNKEATRCVVALLTQEEQRIALQQTRVDSIWGVGRSYATKLINWGITSAWELCNMPEAWAHRNMGGVVGVRLVRELRGIPAIVMEEELVNKKMIATTRMFGRPVTELYELKEAVATYISRAAEKLRRQQSAAGIVSVFIVPKEQDHSADFKHGATVSSYITLPKPTALTHELIKAAVGLVEGLFERGKEYKKAGVMLSGLVPDDSVQGNLFAPASQNQHRFLMHTLDNINFSMRDDAVKFGSSGTDKNWKMRQELRSGRYSTRWEELRQVK